MSAAPVEDDSSFELKLRPQRLGEFIGQPKVKEQLAVAIEAARTAFGRSQGWTSRAGKPFHLVIRTIPAHVVMPDGMTGYQLADAARRLRPDLKVVFTTGYSWLEAPTADAVIHKPYRRQELAVTVRAAQNNAGQDRAHRVLANTEV